jgi:hypothetical protein
MGNGDEWEREMRTFCAETNEQNKQKSICSRVITALTNFSI